MRSCHSGREIWAVTNVDLRLVRSSRIPKICWRCSEVVVRLFEKTGYQEGSREPGIVDTPRELWRMPPLDQLPPARLSLSSRIWTIMLRSYLGVAGGLLLYKLIHLAIFGAAKSG